MVRDQKIIRLLSQCIKVTIVVVALVYIWRKIAQHHAADVWAGAWVEALQQHWFLFAVAVVLMPFNWFLEAEKWRVLIAPLEPISRWRAFRAVLAGVTFGVATPNRLGEFGGRIFFLNKADRVEAAGLAFVGSFAQFLTTFLMGILAFGLSQQSSFFALFHERYRIWLLLASITLLIFLFLLLLFAETFRRFLFQLRLFAKLRPLLDRLTAIERSTHVHIFFLSLLRYLIYSTQFFLVLKSFGVELPLLEGFSAIAITYFAITVIPTFALTEVIVRGTAAVTFIGMLAEPASSILAASLAVWVLNIALPSLFGIAFVFQLRFFSSDQTTTHD